MDPVEASIIIMKEVKRLRVSGIIPRSNSHKEYWGFVFDKSVPMPDIDNSKVKEYFEKLIMPEPMQSNEMKSQTEKNSMFGKILE